MKGLEKIPQTPIEVSLSELWTQFCSEAEDYLQTEAVNANIIDTDPFLAGNKLKATDLQHWSRFLFSEYARKARQLVEKNPS